MAAGDAEAHDEVVREVKVRKGDESAERAKGFPGSFSSPIRSYDVHVYFFHGDAQSSAAARELREEVLREFPELNVYRLWEKPIGPHPVGMFEVDLRTPAQFARFVPWLQAHRRGLSALVHPNTGFPLLDHTVNAMWIGDRYPLITTCLKDRDDSYGL